MNKILTGALAAATLGGVVLGGASTASAREWHGGNGGAAVAAGIAGLAIGAALASNNHGYYGGYYAPAPAYGYGYGYGYGYRHCRLESRWNYRWGGYERVRVCY